MKTVSGDQTRPIEIFALLLMVIFTTELAVMELFGPLFDHLGPFPAAVVDATLLVVIVSFPLWVIFSPVLNRNPAREHPARQLLLRTFVELAAGFFLFELVVMLFLPALMRGANPIVFGMTDAGTTVLLTAPLLWWLLTRLERAHSRIVVADLLESPLLLYLLLLYLIFLADLLQALLIPDRIVLPHSGTSHVVDAVVLTLIIAPFLWLFMARPLRRSVHSERARARAVYEQVIDAIVQVDTGGRITALNPAAQRIFGFNEGELVGRPLNGLFEDNRDELESLLGTAGDSSVEGGVVSRELSAWRRDGSSVTLDVSISRILLSGRMDLLLIMRDISERKEAERALRESDIRFREVYEQSEDAIFFFKPGSTYMIEANTTTERLFGYRRDNLRGDGLARLLREEDLARVRQAISGLRAGQHLLLENVAGRRSDGSECLVSLRAKIMTLQGVEVVYCTLRDITERVRMEREAREIQAKLIQTNKMTSLGLLVSGVAHEINNPNNYIMANAQLLASAWEDSRKVLREYYRENGDFLLGGIPFAEFDEQAPRLLDGILDGSRRIDQIISGLKQYARQEGGAPAAFDINQVADAAVAILQHELVRYTSRFRSELEDDLPKVVGNSQQLVQVVINLLLNACQSLPSPEHGIRLATGFDPKTAMVTVTVQDEGCGIPVENRELVMEPFFTTKLDSGGTGLGLSICRSIVAEHGGFLEFVSTPGQGTTFALNLPAGRAASQDNGR